MKRLLLLFCIIICVLSSFVSVAQKQTKELSDTIKFGEAKCHYKSELKGLSPNSAFLVYDLMKLDRELTKEDSLLIKKYSLKEIGDRFFVGAFIQFSSDFDLSKLSAYEIKVNTKLSTLATVLIPIDRFIEFCQASLVDYIDIGSKAQPMMDNAKNLTGANLVHQGVDLPQGYYGKDVVVGIIDQGFDYTHPNFWDSTLTNYRVKRVWEQEYNYGTPPQNFEYGTELTTQEEILEALYSHYGESHGTHVAGIAAGGGTTVESLSQYKGVAPESDIVLVATDMTTLGICYGIAYIIDYAQSVGKPCVINMSIGSQIGPHDGSSTFDLACDALTQEVSEGVLLVGSAGNNGGTQIHLAKDFSTDSDLLNTFLTFNGSSAGSGIIDIWGSNDFSIQITPYNVEDNEVAGQTLTISTSQEGMYNYSIGDDDLWSTDYCNITVEIQQYQNKKNVLIEIDNTSQDDTEKYLLIQVYANNGIVHMWNWKQYQTFSSMGFSNCQSGNDFYTCGEIGGSGNSMISVGAYTSRSSWTSIYGEYTNTYYDVNDIAPFSSKGPTVDNRIKPDITAPGAMIVSSVNSYDPTNYSLTSSKSINGIIMGQNQEPVLSENTWLWGVMQGTSMAAPVVTGVLAVWLEAYPELTISQAKQILRESAIVDSYTGTIDSTINVNNVTWGAGKVNAYAGLQLLLQKVPNKHLFNTPNVFICNGSSTTLSAPEGYSKYIWSNGDTTRTITVNQVGEYYVRYINAEGYKSPWSDTITVSIYPEYNLTISGNNTICEGSMTNIVVENVNSILWSNGSNSNNLIVSPNESRYYTFTAIDTNNCQIIDSIQIIVQHPQNININATICEGTTYNENGFNVNEAGTYTQTLQTINGCDSIVTLTLNVAPIYNIALSATIQVGESYTENGFNVNEAGVYTRALQSINGCDSIITLTLNITTATVYNDITATICQGQTYAENGFNVSEAGTYTQTLTAINGADSIVTLTLNVLPIFNTELTATICEGQVYTENNFNISEAGVYTQTLTSANGCDSIVTLTLNVNPIFNTPLTATICEGTVYNENGFNVSEAGVYTQTLQTVNGCDSIVTLTLNVNPTFNTELSATICQGQVYTENGFNVSEAGVYTQTLTSVNGCDSIITLTLNILPSYNTNLTATICQGSELNISGFHVTEGGVYTQNLTSVNGCDSIVTLTVTELPIIHTDLTLTMCEGTSLNFSGFNVSEAGVYTQTHTAENGCDSIVTLTVTELPIIHTDLTLSICEGTTLNFSGFNVSEAGTYTQSLQTVNGCDSIVTLVVTTYPTFDTTINATINAGETYAEFGFNESEAGTYVQNLQTVNGCDSTITLILDVNSSLMDVEYSELSFYPNPTDSKITFSSTIESIEVIDQTGRCVLTFSNAREINIESLPSGAYYLRLTNNDKAIMRKVIKE